MSPVVRVSIGHFDADKLAEVTERLAASAAVLEDGIRAMRGNLGYFAGIDRQNNAFSNVSLWESTEDAMQMAAFQPMLDLAGEFIALGVRFDRPIRNFDTVWKLP